MLKIWRPSTLLLLPRLAVVHTRYLLDLLDVDIYFILRFVALVRVNDPENLASLNSALYSPASPPCTPPGYLAVAGAWQSRITGGCYNSQRPGLAPRRPFFLLRACTTTASANGESVGSVKPRDLRRDSSVCPDD